MKTKLSLLTLSLAGVLCLPLGAKTSADKSAQKPAGDRASSVEVNFKDPEKFTDLREEFGGPTDSAIENYTYAFRTFIQDNAGYYLKDGQKLSVTFTDIDLAGDFEPWHGPQMDDVRIVKEIYPPRMSFDFKVTDASGKVIKEGHRDLRDLTFTMNVSIDRNDPLHYEKSMLRDWMRDDLRS